MLSVVVVGCQAGPDYCDDGVVDVGVVVDINVVDGIGMMSGIWDQGTDQGPTIRCISMDVVSLQTYKGYGYVRVGVGVLKKYLGVTHANP